MSVDRRKIRKLSVLFDNHRDLFSNVLNELSKKHMELINNADATEPQVLAEFYQVMDKFFPNYNEMRGGNRAAFDTKNILNNDMGTVSRTVQSIFKEVGILLDDSQGAQITKTDLIDAIQQTLKTLKTCRDDNFLQSGIIGSLEEELADTNKRQIPRDQHLRETRLKIIQLNNEISRLHKAIDECNGRLREAQAQDERTIIRLKGEKTVLTEELRRNRAELSNCEDERDEFTDVFEDASDAVDGVLDVVDGRPDGTITVSPILRRNVQLATSRGVTAGDLEHIRQMVGVRLSSFAAPDLTTAFMTLAPLFREEMAGNGPTTDGPPQVEGGAFRLTTAALLRAIDTATVTVGGRTVTVGPGNVLRNMRNAIHYMQAHPSQTAATAATMAVTAVVWNYGLEDVQRRVFNVWGGGSSGYSEDGTFTVPEFNATNSSIPSGPSGPWREEYVYPNDPPPGTEPEQEQEFTRPATGQPDESQRNIFTHENLSLGVVLSALTTSMGFTNRGAAHINGSFDARHCDAFIASFTVI